MYQETSVIELKNEQVIDKLVLKSLFIFKYQIKYYIIYHLKNINFLLPLASMVSLYIQQEYTFTSIYRRINCYFKIRKVVHFRAQQQSRFIQLMIRLNVTFLSLRALLVECSDRLSYPSPKKSYK